MNQNRQPLDHVMQARTRASAWAARVAGLPLALAIAIGAAAPAHAQMQTATGS